MFQPVIKFLVPPFQNFLGPSLFFYEYSIFFLTSYFTQAISQNSSKPMIVKSFCLLRTPNDCYFRWAGQGPLPQCNRRNIATVLRTMVKPHKGLKGTKVFACGCFGKNLKNFSKFVGKSSWWSLFIVKLPPVIAFKKTKVTITRSNLSKREAYTETVTQVFLKKIMNTTILRECLWNNVK